MKNKRYDVVILAGGKGTRIKHLTNNVPKPLAKIGERPFLDILIRNISKYNLNKIFILAGHKGNKIKKRYHKKKINLINIECIVEKKPLGTGGCLKLIEKKLSKNFFVLNGDTFFDVNLNDIFLKNYKSNKILMCLSNSKNYKSNTKLTKLSINSEKNVILKSTSTYFNGGTYLINKKFITKHKKKNFSLENDIILRNIKKRKVKGNFFSNFFIDIGTPKNFKLSNKILPKYLYKPAIFIDRDGTIIKDKGYVHKLKDLRIIGKTIRAINYKNCYKFIVTNQSGIGRGYFSEQDFFRFQNHLKWKLIKHNILIDDVRYCPFIQNAKFKKYNKKSQFRKPDNLMLIDLCRKYFIDLKNSVMIGNSISDKLCAEKTKIQYFDVNEISTNRIKEFFNKN